MQQPVNAKARLFIRQFRAVFNEVPQNEVRELPRRRERLEVHNGSFVRRRDVVEDALGVRLRQLAGKHLRFEFLRHHLDVIEGEVAGREVLTDAFHLFGRRAALLIDRAVRREERFLVGRVVVIVDRALGVVGEFRALHVAAAEVREFLMCVPRAALRVVDFEQRATVAALRPLVEFIAHRLLFEDEALVEIRPQSAVGLNRFEEELGAGVPQNEELCVAERLDARLDRRKSRIGRRLHIRTHGTASLRKSVDKATRAADEAA